MEKIKITEWGAEIRERLTGVINHEAKGLGLFCIVCLNFTSLLAVGGTLDGFEEFAFPWLMVSGTVLVVAMNLFTTAAIIQTCFFPPRRVGQKENALIDLENRLLDQNLRRGKGIALITPGQENKAFFIVGRDEYLKNQ